MKKLLMLLVAVLVLTSHARADDEDIRAVPEDAQAMVKNAVAYLKRHGREKALKEFQNPNGPFVYKELYVVVFDLKGKCVAHGKVPARVGMDLSDEKDPDGKPIMRERMEIANTQGSGWQTYKFLNPVTKAVEQRTSYLEKYEDLIVTSGSYKRMP